MKRLLVSLFIVMMVGGVASAASYSDLKEDNPYYKAVQYLSEKSVVNGYPDGTFKTDQFVNRAEAMKMIVNAFGVPEADLLMEKFPDVQIREWYFDYVMNAEKAGIVNGYPDNTFKPANNVNFAESLKMAILAGNFSLDEAVGADVFMDVKKSEWFAKYFLMARDTFVVTSDEWGLVDPGQEMTRGKFAEMIYRLLTVKDSGGLPYPIENDWDDYKSKSLGVDMKLDLDVLKIDEGMNSVAIWRADLGNGQFTVDRVFPNTGKMWLAIDSNEKKLSSSAYFQAKRAVFQNASYAEKKIGGLDALEISYEGKNVIDWYIYKNDKKVLAVYTEIGGGVMADDLENNIRKIVETITVSGASTGTSNQDLLQQIFANILIEGAGMESLDKVSDKTLIETDSIGVGTGPVDYYFSLSLGYTFKYERASDVILDKREGQTSAF